MNYNQKIFDYKEDSRTFMAEKGLPFNEEFISDGRIVRYSADGNKSKRDEWYIAFEGTSSQGNNYWIVIFGSWSDGSKYEYRSFDKNQEHDELEIAELREMARLKRLKLDQEIKEENDKAAELAKNIWGKSHTNPPTEEYTQYAKNKGIKIPSNVRFGSLMSNPLMIVPLFNSKQELRSLQFISPDGLKRFLKGGEKRGNFHVIGTISQEETYIYFVEGLATGASVFEAVNKPVVICFDAGNIEPVVEAFKEKYPEMKVFIIAADNDVAGREKAKRTSDKFGCKVVFPEFPKELDDKKYTDFNDLHQACGIEVVRHQLTQKEFKSIGDLLGQKQLAESYLSENQEPCDKFKLSALPPALEQYVSFLCEDTKAHPIIVTASVLTMVSAYLGTKVYIQYGNYFQDLYPNLWTLCIARSGQFKTTALNKGAKIAYDNQAKVFALIKELKQKIAQEEDIQAQILEKSRENVILPTKITAEGFLEYLADGHQGAVYASEFGGWLQNLDKNHNNDFKAILTEFYDVPMYYRYKTKTQGDCIIQKPFMSICGVSTMPWIRLNIKPTDIPSGFFARFLIFTPPYQADVPPALPSNKKGTLHLEEEGFKGYLEYALDQLGDDRAYYLTEEARNLFTSLHESIYAESKLYQERSQDILQPYLKRWSPYLLKLAMIMQFLLDFATDQISAAAIIMAYNILLPAMRSTALLLEKDLGESDHQRKCRILFEWICGKIKSTGKPVKRKAIMSSRKLEGGKKDYDYVLETLIAQGKIEYITHEKKNDSEYILVEEIEKS